MPVETIDFKVIKIHRLGKDSRIKAFVDLGINDALLIKGIRIVQGKKGLFVSMPTQQGKNERWYERVRCLNEDVRLLMAEKVLEAYNA
ncbi:MAG: septation protein SpoVG family protein [Candidatus Omnitrophica bacterium]|nr:septation protein SpoVG family protein [Candidatus Omnitrophota bacterium]